MSMIDVHSAALAAINESYHDFLLRFNRTRKVVFGFVEGKEDPSFYRSVIERFIPQDWAVDLILAGNRTKVLAVETAFDWTRFSPDQISFFVDRDLTDLTAAGIVYPDNVYVTDGYSIENSIVTSDVMLRLLSEVHNVVDWTDDEKDEIVRHFNCELERFGEAMLPIMAQIACWRIDGVRANLNNLDLSSLFEFSAGSVLCRGPYNDVDERIRRVCECVGAVPCPIENRDQAQAALLAAGGPLRLLRGKYLVWFLSGMVNEIHRMSHQFVAAYQRPPKAKMALAPGNVMVVAAPRARIPASLRHFVESGYLSFVAAREAA